MLQISRNFSQLVKHSESDWRLPADVGGRDQYESFTSVGLQDRRS